MGIKQKLQIIDDLTVEGIKAADKNAIARNEKNESMVDALLRHIKHVPTNTNFSRSL